MCLLRLCTGPVRESSDRAGVSPERLNSVSSGVGVSQG